MSKVTGVIKLIKDPKRSWVLVPVDLNNVKQQCVDKWVKSDAVQSIALEMEIKFPYIEKTLSQLGYLHAACYPIFYAHQTTQGIIIETDEQKRTVVDELKYAVGFVEKVQDMKGGTHFKPKSMADASKEEGSEFIDSLIRLGAEFGLVIESPESYLHKLGFDKFDDDEK